MKTGIAFFLATLFPLLLLAQDDSTDVASTLTYIPYKAPVVEKLNWDGYFQTDDRVSFRGEPSRLLFQEYRLAIKPSIRGVRTAFGSEIWLRSVKFPHPSSYTQLGDKSKVAPIDADLREAWVDIYGFLSKDIDLRIGRQRIVWGTADRLNPTDNLNPYDMEDIWDFGRHLPSNSIKLTWYKAGFALTGVLTPMFTPSLTPSGEWTQAFMPSFNLPSEIDLGLLTLQLVNEGIADTLILPQYDIKKSASFGAKLEKDIGNFKASVSILKGHEIVPAPLNASITPSSIAIDTIKYILNIELMYPEITVIGADLAGSIWDVGVWAEAAYFFSEEIRLSPQIDLFGITFPLTDTLIYDGKPYIKYVFGADYTFKNNIYINVQWLHGFVHEKGSDALNNYIVGVAEWKTLRDKLKISPVNFCLQMKSFENFSDNYAIVWLPELAYKAADNLEISLGARFIEGAETTLFGRMKDQSHAFLKCRFSF